MATNTAPATDSAKELNQLIGDDATATFESDPTFVDSNPGGTGSSENSVGDVEDTDDSKQTRHAATLHADGLLGQEDEIEDTREKRDRSSGDAAREKAESKIKDGDSTDDDAGDVARGIDEDKLDEDDMDTDQVATPDLHAVMAAQSAAITQSYVRA